MRRWVVLVLAALVVLGSLAAAGWFWAVPEYRPSLRAGEDYGIDVSHHQGAVDWGRVAGDDIAFAYIKATEGKDHLDRRFEANWRDAAAAGVERGAYHFFTLCSPGAEQAAHFLSVVPPDPAVLAPALDLELAGNCSRRPSRADVGLEVDQFLEVVEAAWGRPVLLYIGDDWEGRYPTRDRSARPLWHRRWFRRANVDGWVIWQFTGLGRVEGIEGDVDVNVRRPSGGDG